jgi:hypothetical protein
MQQINLYLSEFQPNREPLRSIHMLWGLAAFILILVLMSLLSAHQNRQRAETIHQQNAQLDELKSRAVQLEQQRPTINLADLEAQAAKLVQELKRREQVYQVIANKDLGNNAGFSAHLQALGRQSLDTISLEAFSLIAGGNYVELAGKAQTVDQVPLYVQRLRSEAVFSQAGFGVFNAQPQKTSSMFQFSLARQTNSNQREEAKTAVQELIDSNAEADANNPARGQN